jgi:hypothetical protein
LTRTQNELCSKQSRRRQIKATTNPGERLKTGDFPGARNHPQTTATIRAGAETGCREKSAAEDSSALARKSCAATKTGKRVHTVLATWAHRTRVDLQRALARERWELDTQSVHKDHKQKRNEERKKTESREEKSTGAHYGSQSQTEQTRPAPRSEGKTITKITTAQLAREMSWATKSRRHRKSQHGSTSGRRTREQKIHRGFNKKKPPDLTIQKSKGRKCKIQFFIE